MFAITPPLVSEKLASERSALTPGGVYLLPVIVCYDLKCVQNPPLPAPSRHIYFFLDIFPPPPNTLPLFPNATPESTAIDTIIHYLMHD